MYAWGLFGVRFVRQVTILSYQHKIRTRYLSPFFVYKDNLFPAIFYHQYIFRLVQRVSKKTKKPLLLCLFLQQKSEIWILLTMLVKYWPPLPTRWKLEATLSMKEGTAILLLQRVSVLFFPTLTSWKLVKFQLNEPLSHTLGIFFFISPAGYGQFLETCLPHSFNTDILHSSLKWFHFLSFVLNGWQIWDLNTVRLNFRSCLMCSLRRKGGMQVYFLIRSW